MSGYSVPSGHIKPSSQVKWGKGLTGVNIPRRRTSPLQLESEYRKAFLTISGHEGRNVMVTVLLVGEDEFLKQL